MKFKALKVAFPHTIPILVGYLCLGTAFGILLSGNGFHFALATIMSIFIYAGSMQFVSVGLLTNSFDVMNAIIITLVVNARHVFYGLSMLSKFNAMGKKKPYMIFSLTDETFSLLCSIKPPADVDENWFYFFTSMLNHLYWILGSTIGGLIGSLFSFNYEGVDFIMTALFVVIFIDQWQSVQDHKPAIIGVVSSLICLILFGAENFVIPTMIFILLLVSLSIKHSEKRNT